MTKVIPGTNDLATVNPALVAEWHPTKNGKLTPSQFTGGSGKKVWWLGKCGHEWQMSIRDRNTKGAGCPICYGRQVLPGFNDLATVRPELAAEWHPTKNGELTPSQVAKTSNKKVWWQCAEGHEWQAVIANRTQGRGCPYCSGKKVLPGFNDLTTIHPELATEWHPTKNGELTPEHVAAKSNKKVWWLCDKGHEWQAVIATRSNGCGCPQCANECKTSFSEQAFYFYLNQINNAQNRYLLNGKTEIDVYLPEYKIGIEYDGEMWHRNMQKDLYKNRICERAGVRLLRIREPGLPPLPVECIVLESTQNDILEKAIRQVCAMLGKTVDVNIERDRTKIYAQYIESTKQNSLAVKNPDVAAEWHPMKNGVLNPWQVPKSSGKKVWWQCSKCGHEWQAPIFSRSKPKGNGCPVCSPKVKVVKPGINDIATTHPKLAAEWHPTKNGELSPSAVSKGSFKKVWWQCERGHEWQARVAHRTQGRGCPVCAGRKTLEK